MEPTKTSMTQPSRTRAQTWIFSGDEAFAEVAKPDGFWNWAVVGPDSTEDLQIEGGGRGGVAEMQAAMSDIGNHFGLLRLAFGTGDDQRTKWVFINITAAFEEAGAEPDKAAERRAQSAEFATVMQKKLSAYVTVSASVEVARSEDASLEALIAKLVEAEPDEAEGLTAQSYDAALQEFLRPDDAEEDAEHGVDEVMEEIMNNPPPALEPDAGQEAFEQAPAEGQEDDGLTKQRKPIKVYGKGEYVQVYSNAANIWHDDGVIIEVIEEQSMKDGFLLAAGSMKAQYSNGKRFKWVTPLQADSSLRASCSGGATQPPRRRACSPTASCRCWGSSS